MSRRLRDWGRWPITGFLQSVQIDERFLKPFVVIVRAERQRVKAKADMRESILREYLGLDFKSPGDMLYCVLGRVHLAGQQYLDSTERAPALGFAAPGKLPSGHSSLLQ